MPARHHHQSVFGDGPSVLYSRSACRHCQRLLEDLSVHLLAKTQKRKNVEPERLKAVPCHGRAAAECALAWHCLPNVHRIDSATFRLFKCRAGRSGRGTKKL